MRWYDVITKCLALMLGHLRQTPNFFTCKNWGVIYPILQIQLVLVLLKYVTRRGYFHILNYI